MKLVSQQTPRRLFCWRACCPEKQDVRDGLQCFCKIVASRSMCHPGRGAGGSSQYPQRDSTFHQCCGQTACPPQPEIDGEGGADGDHPGENPSVFSLEIQGPSPPSLWINPLANTQFAYTTFNLQSLLTEQKKLPWRNKNVSICISNDKMTKWWPKSTMWYFQAPCWEWNRQGSRAAILSGGCQSSRHWGRQR